MDTCVKMEIRINQIFVLRYVVMDSTLVFCNAMMAICSMATVVIQIARSKEVGIALEVLPFQKIHAMSCVAMAFFSKKIILATKKVVKAALIYPAKQFQGTFAIINAEYLI